MEVSGPFLVFADSWSRGVEQMIVELRGIDLFFCGLAGMGSVCWWKRSGRR